MAFLYLLSSMPSHDDDALSRLRASARQDPFGVHAVTDDPDAADLIVFAESWAGDWLLRSVRTHPLVQAHREKCFVVCERDLVVPFLPGVYANVTRRATLPGRVRQGHYLWMYENTFVDYAPDWHDDMYLFSFVGSFQTAPVRTRFAALRHPRALVRDTSQQSSFIWWEATDAEKATFRRDYAAGLRDSRFVLCPRGISPTTVRLFEAMKTGRVPVILSDDWVPPTGPDWSAFSVRVPEQDVASIPALLESLEPEAQEMGNRARAAWENWFSPVVTFHRVAEWCLNIHQTRSVAEKWGRYAVYVDILRNPTFRRELLSHTKRTLVSAFQRLRVTSAST